MIRGGKMDYVTETEKIKKFKAQRNIKEIIKALRYEGGMPDWENEVVQGKAAEALGRIKDNSAVVPLIRLLSSERVSWTLAKKVAMALGEIGDKRAVLPLYRLFILNAVFDEWGYFEAGREALEKIGYEKIAEVLIEALKSGKRKDRNCAICIFGNFFEDSYDFVKGRWILGDTCPEYCIVRDIMMKDVSEADSLSRILFYALGDKDEDVRDAAKRILGKMLREAEKPFVELLSAFLKDNDKNIRAGVMCLLENMVKLLTKYRGIRKTEKTKLKSVVLYLLRAAFQNDYLDVRCRADVLLSLLREKSTVEFLIQALTSSSPHCSFALEKITRKRFYTKEGDIDIERWQKWWEENRGTFY